MLNKILFWPAGLGALVLLSFAPIARGGVLITGAEEVGGINDAVGPYVTGETFNHEVEGDNFTVPFLDEDVPFFVDRAHEYNGISTTDTIASLGLVGAEYVMVANDNKGVVDYELEIQVAQTVDAFYFQDERNAEIPPWLEDNGWVWTGYEMGIDEGGDGVGPGQGINQRFWIWKKTNIPPGTLTTYESLSAGNNMYGVAFTLPGQGPGIKDFPEEWPGADFKPGNFGLIDIGATGGRAEAGALQDTLGVAQIGGGAHNENGFDLDPTDMTSNLGDDFTITIDTLDEEEVFVGGLDWRDRGNSIIADVFDLPLVKLGEDLVKNNAGVIRVTLSDLPAGPYQVTSFHLDPGFDQCEAISIFVDVGDGNGFMDTGELANADLLAGGIGGVTPELMLESSATFDFTADGIHDVMILFDGRLAGDTEVPFNGLSIQFGAITLPGDYNQNDQLDAGDLDLQASVGIKEQDLTYDLNEDGIVDYDGDRVMWLHDLKKVPVGDADLNGSFTSDDFVTVFTSGLYETGAPATWEQGDWSGDLVFDSNDFVAAFIDGYYEQQNPLAGNGAVAAVPEPGGLLLLLFGVIGLAVRRR